MEHAVYLLYEYNAESMSGHSYISKIFSTRTKAEKYIFNYFGHNVVPKNDHYEDVNFSRGYKIQKMNVDE